MTKIVFRLNYRTVVGQSLWVKVVFAGDGVRFGQMLPMRWINAGQWQAEWEVERGLRVEYRYVFRQESNGVELEEWGEWRKLENTVAGWVALDTWRSAGTVDNAYETKAFPGMERRERSDERGALPGNHHFRLKMAGVPEGLVVCVMGGEAELGGWSRAFPVVMAESEANVWEAGVFLHIGRDVEYKYGLYDPVERRVVEVEEGENRGFHVPPVAPLQVTRVADEAYRRPAWRLFRGAGVAVPVFSLRSEGGLGIGEFADLKGLADWAADAGLKLIQILPINDTTSTRTWTDSYPYSAISAFALHPVYLRIDALTVPLTAEQEERLADERRRLNEAPQVDYEAVLGVKSGFLREIYDGHRTSIRRSPGFTAFVEENRSWLWPYAAFCVMRDRKGTADFSKWDEWSVYDRGKVDALLDEGGEDWPEAAFHLWLQFELDRQLLEAVGYLHEKGIALKGDLPIGIDRESVDAWSAPHLYHMDAQSGAPPDAFAVKGQNWGFPTYNWEVMKRDGYAWWRSRFAQLSRYFDAYRIDHILGFFRIWQVPLDQVDGIMGWFDPSLSIGIGEFAERGIPFDRERFCSPYLREENLGERFGIYVPEVKERFLDEVPGGWRLKPEFATQRRILDWTDDSWNPAVREALLDCVSDVLFFEVPGSGGSRFYPRCGMQLTRSYQALDAGVRWKVEDLYNDYFYRRQEDFWEAKGYEKLPAMRRASRMLLCGEDLGMVPACVPGVLRETGILSLEIQRMPKVMGVRFFNPAHAPYLSVVSPSTHDMQTLREWWEEDGEETRAFAWEMFGISEPPRELPGEIAGKIVQQHLESPAMWAVFPLQDLLAMDEGLRHPDVKAERINVPAIIPFYWRYRMHLGLEELLAASGFGGRIREMVRDAGR